ncbi:MAG: hypothetical protein RBQ97_08585 [Acholeplasma sp.]|nr:hypothetical protein [Acholeplasma sp.]
METYDYFVKCDICGKRHSISVDFFPVDWDSDREMGTETYYQGDGAIECECGKHLSVTVQASEYPEGAGIEVYDVSTQGCKLTK